MNTSDYIVADFTNQFNPAEMVGNLASSVDSSEWTATSSSLVSKDQFKLYLALHELSTYNLPVFPLLGDLSPFEPKRPATAWKKYQNGLPTDTELHEWVYVKGYKAWGAVTGQFSGQVVLDFDVPEIAEAFAAELPDLLETRIEQSPGIDHPPSPRYIYRLPNGADFRSRGKKGAVELLGDGRYYVCAPSKFSSKEYTVQRGGMPKLLTHEQAARLIAFVERYEPFKTEPISADGAIPTDDIDPSRWRNLYHNNVRRYGGRNEAAFHTGRAMRDTGIQEAMTLDILMSVFIYDTIPSNHHSGK